jgi:hypothetical protein
VPSSSTPSAVVIGTRWRVGSAAGAGVAAGVWAFPATAALGDNPRPPGCVKLAGADDLWRIRVGQYRVVYAIREAELLVLVARVAHRRDVYRGL